MSINRVSVVTPNGEHTIMTSRPKAVQAVITTAIMTTLMPFYEEIMTVFCTDNMTNNI